MMPPRSRWPWSRTWPARTSTRSRRRAPARRSARSSVCLERRWATRVGRSRVAVSNLIRLLDLPDEAIGAIEVGQLSEGHGRALLTATDHDARRRLARSAITDAWSVRELEARAREANDQTDAPRRPRRRTPRLHPDQEAVVTQIHDSFGAVFGREVDVSAAAGGGYTIALSFESADEALELAGRLRP